MGMVQFAKPQGNTFSDTQKARPHETKGFGFVVLCQKCNPREPRRTPRIGGRNRVSEKKRRSKEKMG